MPLRLDVKVSFCASKLVVALTSDTKSGHYLDSKLFLSLIFREGCLLGRTE